MTENKKGKVRQFLPTIISGVVLLTSAGIMSVANTAQARDLANREAEKVALQNKIDQLSVENKTTVTEIQSQATGVDSKRVEQDDRVVKSLLTKTFTWKSYKEYIAVRESLMKDYHLSSDSSFLQTFIPEIFNENIDGKDYNRIDMNGYNITFNSVDSYVTSVDDDTKVYEYFAIVNVTSKSENEGSDDYDLALQYKVASNQQIMDITGYILD